MKKNSSVLLITLASIAAILLAIVDFRRGFLFGTQAYIYKTPFFIFSPWQALMFFAGMAGLKAMAPALKRLSIEENKRLLFSIFVLLLFDLALYRGVAMNRSMTAGKVGLDWMNAFGETGSSKTIFLSASYLLTVWHATFLAALLSGWSVLALPHFTRFLKSRTAVNPSILGAAYSLTQPLCSCCVALTAPGLFKSSVPRSFTTSVLIGAPMLSLSTLFLAATLLPWPYSSIRILGGLLLTIALSYVAGKFLSDGSAETFRLPEPSAQNLPMEWLLSSARLFARLLPSIVVGILFTSFLWQFWPTDFANSWSSVALVSILGSVLMISTWSEIPLALQMINQGLTGPAAAALIALPAVNLASILLIGKNTGQWRLALSLGALVMTASFLVGMSFV